MLKKVYNEYLCTLFFMAGISKKGAAAKATAPENLKGII